MSNSSGNSRKDPGNIALQWWQELRPQEAGDTAHRGDPAALARLRRAATPVEALTEASAIRLARRLGITPDRPDQLARIGAIAAVLAHVRTHDDGGQKVARRLGPQKKDEPGVMSALRFQRLMAAETAEDLMRQMRNAVKLLQGKADVADIARSMFWWNEATRIRWIYDYHNAGDAAPEISNDQQRETIS